jgi:DNA-binding YbaB/EbfC family protein
MDFFSKVQEFIKDSSNIESQFKKVQEELAGKVIKADSGAGMVEVEVNGKLEFLSVKIDPSLFEKNDKQFIESLVCSAFNAALKKAQQMVSQEVMKRGAAGFDFSKLFGGNKE